VPSPVDHNLYSASQAVTDSGRDWTKHENGLQLAIAAMLAGVKVSLVKSKFARVLTAHCQWQCQTVTAGGTHQKGIRQFVGERSVQPVEPSSDTSSRSSMFQSVDGPFSVGIVDLEFDDRPGATAGKFEADQDHEEVSNTLQSAPRAANLPHACACWCICHLRARAERKVTA
jgi:hypothetical protein